MQNTQKRGKRTSIWITLIARVSRAFPRFFYFLHIYQFQRKVKFKQINYNKNFNLNL